MEVNFTSQQTALPYDIYIIYTTGKVPILLFYAHFHVPIYNNHKNISIRCIAIPELKTQTQYRPTQYLSTITMIMMREFYSTIAYYILWVGTYVMFTNVYGKRVRRQAYTHFPSGPNTPIQT